jgi:hypothetical protein
MFFMRIRSLENSLTLALSLLPEGEGTIEDLQ